MRPLEVCHMDTRIQAECGSERESSLNVMYLYTRLAHTHTHIGREPAGEVPNRLTEIQLLSYVSIEIQLSVAMLISPAFPPFRLQLPLPTTVWHAQLFATFTFASCVRPVPSLAPIGINNKAIWLLNAALNVLP